jgi:TolB-like protein/Tfp pilus assembly protein PilF
MPFTNLSGDSGQDYFSDGITDDLTTDLSRLPNLFVIARNSAFTYKGKAEKVQQVGRELGVKYLLEGSIRRAGDQIRINVQLVDAASGNQVWGQRYDRQLSDIFKLQDEIVHSLVATLGVQLSLLEKGFVFPQRTSNLEAYDYYLRGLEQFYVATPDAFASATKMFEEAIALDPDYSDAYVLLSVVRDLAAMWQWDTDPDALDQAEKLARRGISLDDSNSIAYGTLGMVSMARGRLDEAVAYGKRAVALDSCNSSAYIALSDTLNTVGKPEEALAYAQKAMRLDPRHPEWYSLEAGAAYDQLGRYQDALAALTASIPTNPWVHVYLIYTYSELGREQDARAEAAEVHRVAPKFSLEAVVRGNPTHWGMPFPRHMLEDLREAGLK